MSRRHFCAQPLRAALCTAALLAAAPHATAQFWILNGTGSWTEGSHWSGGVAPRANAAVFVTNGGTATLMGSPLPLLNTLAVGSAGLPSGNGIGAVFSDGVNIHLSSVVQVGFAMGTGSFASGVLQIQRASGSAANAVVGTIFGDGSTPASVSGRIAVDGDFLLGGEFSFLGATLSAAPGSVATGTMLIGGHAGQMAASMIGSSFSTVATNVGSQARGRLDVGGNLLWDTGTFPAIGSTIGFDRLVDPAAPGGARVDEARGQVVVGGTLRSATSTGSTRIGTTNGGRADGSLAVGTIDTSVHRMALTIGSAGALGQARGELRAASGDLRTAGDLRVGVASGGMAQGLLTLGGSLHGDGGALQVGSVSGAQPSLPSTAMGDVRTAGAVSGYGNLLIGSTFGSQGAGTLARGSLSSGAGLALGPVASANVGSVIFNDGGAVTVTGDMHLGHSLQAVNADLSAGFIFLSGSGSVAAGRMRIDGDAGTARSLMVGATVAGTGQTGLDATGEVLIRGDLALVRDGFMFVGNTSGEDRSSGVAAPRFDQARGNVVIDGILRLAGNALTVAVGVVNGGQADGKLSLAHADMAGHHMRSLMVGSSLSGQAQGELSLRGGVLRAIDAEIGTTRTGSALGRFLLSGAELQTTRLLAGDGAGARAELEFVDALATITDDFSLGNGRLELERSLVLVGDQLALGRGALLHVDVDGLARGDGYGAMNAASALLGGLLEVDFEDLVFGGVAAVFDLVRSGSALGVLGDFAGVSFLNLPAGYRAWAGIERDGVAVYRVHLALATVPSIGSLALAALGLCALLLCPRRKSGWASA